MDDYQIIIEREHSLYGCALKHSVELDGFSVGILKNGQSLIIHTTPGNHTLSFVSRGKIEKSVPIAIGPDDYVTRIYARLNARQKIEIEKDISSNAVWNTARKKKNHSVSKIIATLLAIFAVLWVVGSIGDDTASTPLQGNSVVSELTDEERATEQLEKATEQFHSGKYMNAIEICNTIVSDYPDTEIAIGISSYLDEQFAQYPHYSAENLMFEYDANVVNADEAYTDTVMVVTGTVSSIGKTNNGTNLTVMLKSGTYFYGVQLNFKTSQTESVAALREGDAVTAVGKCTGKSGKQFIVLDGNNVMIENCYLIGG